MPLFTEPSATNNYRGSPNNNEGNFPEVHENHVDKKATRTCFFFHQVSQHWCIKDFENASLYINNIIKNPNNSTFETTTQI